MKISAEGSALRKSATTVATAASSLKHGTSTAIRIDDGVIAKLYARLGLSAPLPISRSSFHGLSKGNVIPNCFPVRNQGCEQQSPKRKHPDWNCIVQSKNRVGHEENQVHHKISSDDKSELPCSVLIAPTQHRGGPCACNDQQPELQVPGVCPKHAGAQFPWRDIGTAIGGRERTSRIDRIREQRRNNSDQECYCEQRALQNRF